MKLAISHSLKARHVGLEITKKESKIKIAKGYLILPQKGKVELKEDKNFTLPEGVDTIGLVRDRKTNEVGIGLWEIQTGRIDKEKFELIERLAWKGADNQWHALRIEKPTVPIKETVPRLPKTKKSERIKLRKGYKYEDVDPETIQRDIGIQGRRTIPS